MSPQRSFALFLLGLASASAQQPAAVPGRPAPPPGVPVPGVIPAPPAGAPALRPVGKLPEPQPGVPLGETKIVEPIEELKLNGDSLAGLYRRYTGRRVIVTTAASTAEFRFVQDASPEDPLTFAEAAELLRKQAILENFVFVPDTQNPNWDVLTVATGGPNPKGIGIDVYNKDGAVRTYSENDPLPEGDAVISYVMTLNYIKPADAQNAFVSIIGQFGSYGSITAIPNASALIITENTTLIRKLIDLKSEIDKPGSVQATRFIKVQYADVTEIADTLTTLLTAQQTGQKTAGIQRADSNAAPAGVPQVAGQPGGGSTSGEDTPVQIVPDPRTNRIFAMGRPVDLIFVENLVREFDVETSEKNFLRRKLRFLKVADFLPIAGDALGRAFSGTSDGGSSGGSQGGATGSSGQSSGNRTQSAGRSSRSTGANFGSSSSGSSSSGSSSFGSGSSGSSDIGGSGGSSGGGNALSDPDVDSAPESVLIGRTLLVADKITNSVVVQGPPSGLEIIERLLDQIDVKPDQVLISTVIGQLSLNDSNEFGLSYLWKSDSIAAGGGGTSGSIFSPPINTGTGTGTGSGTGTGTGTTGNVFPRFDVGSLSGQGLRAVGSAGNLDIYLKALQSKSDFTVLSRPSIFTANNQKGTISSGERIAIPTSNNNFSGGGSSTNIEYQDVVLKLEVIPLVNSDNEITMKIALLNDEQNGTQTIPGGGSNGGDLTVPKISTRELLTTATVPNGDTIVLGGLIVGRQGKDVSGIPILSDIPYLGRLFSTTTNTDNRSELMVLIQPSVVKNDRSLQAVQADMDARHKIATKIQNDTEGIGVLPPIGAVESNYNSPSTTKAHRSHSPEPIDSPASNIKPKLRPIYRH